MRFASINVRKGLADKLPELIQMMDSERIHCLCIQEATPIKTTQTGQYRVWQKDCLAFIIHRDISWSYVDEIVSEKFMIVTLKVGGTVVSNCYVRPDTPVADVHGATRFL